MARRGRSGKTSKRPNATLLYLFRAERHCSTVSLSIHIRIFPQHRRKWRLREPCQYLQTANFTRQKFEAFTVYQSAIGNPDRRKQQLASGIPETRVTHAGIDGQCDHVTLPKFQVRDLAASWSPTLQQTYRKQWTAPLAEFDRPFH
jgi:hypothetical protein